jgi:hypothetical protein
VAEGRGDDQPPSKDAAPSRGYLTSPTQVSRDSYRGRRPTSRRNCRNEYFIHTHISARNGILTYAASALLTIAVQSFQSFYQEIRSPI